jgi:BirA family biotin operon repressor/biotin-[acetyl-CoA-carboxylase] ligase
LPLPPVAHSLGTPFIELQSVDSTNNYALAQIHANLAQPGTCYFAHEQTAGKGQRGKSWATERGANITLSIILKPGILKPFQQFQLSTCVAIATHNFLSKYAGQTIKIKWPNDLYWKNRKLGGVLMENIIGGVTDVRGQVTAEQPSVISYQPSNWKWAIIGIGINVNQTIFPSDLKNPVSLKQITGQNFDTVQLAKELCESADYFYKRLINNGADPLLDTYNQVLYKKDEVVTLKKDNRIFKTIVKGVSQTGQLITQQAVEEIFEFGEVEWVL